MSPGGWRALGYALLWGAAVTAMESFTLPLGRVPLPALLEFVARLLPRWCLSGLLLVALTRGLGQRQGGPGGVWLLLGFALSNCGIWWLVDRPAILPADDDDVYLHVLWSSLVYGGLFVLAHRLSLRSEHARGRLAQAEIARQTTEAELSAARLQALRGQVDPAFLLRVIGELERRYAGDADDMERLLAPLVEFLRRALPGLSGPSSSMAAEWRLAGLFVALLGELEPARHRWRLSADPALPDAAFPALLLLPALEQLAAAEGGPDIGLRLHQLEGRCVLRFERMLRAPGRWMAPALEYRLRAALRALHGLDWTLELGESPPAPALLLSVPLRKPDALPGVQHG